MSQERVVAFVQAVSDDPRLAARCSAAGSLEEVVGIAAELGYVFEQRHLAGYAQALGPQSGDELSDEDLEGVAGGFGLLDQEAVTINNNHRQVMSTFPEVGSITSVLGVEPP